LLQEQIESGILTPERAKFSLNKNLVTRALGIEELAPADIAEYRVEAGDVFLLCSDGLSDMVDDQEMGEILMAADGDLQLACRNLIDAANRNGGHDNITTVLVRVVVEINPNAVFKPLTVPA